MTLFYRGTSRELAKLFWDICKLTATAAFITPYFTTADVESDVTSGMATTAVITFIVGMIFHRKADTLESNERKGYKKKEEKEKREELPIKEGKRKRRRRESK